MGDVPESDALSKTTNLNLALRKYLFQTLIYFKLETEYLIPKLNHKINILPQSLLFRELFEKKALVQILV